MPTPMSKRISIVENNKFHYVKESRRESSYKSNMTVDGRLDRFYSFPLLTRSRMILASNVSGHFKGTLWVGI